MPLICGKGSATVARIGRAICVAIAVGFGALNVRPAQAVGGKGFRVSNTNNPASAINTTNLGNLGVTQVELGCCGLASFVLGEDGRVFSWGENGNGELGLTGVTDQFVSIPMAMDTSNLGGLKITQVAEGGRMLLAEDGNVFWFGAGTPIATPIDTTGLGGRKIKQVCAGFSHNLLLAEDGTVFSFGGGTSIASPIDSTNLGGRKIAQVSAGFNHALLLAEDGSVFSFGSNAGGRTGQGTSVGETPIATPIDTTNLGGRKITQVEAGSGHSLLLAEDGSVFAFGTNFYGQTGLGTTVGDTLVATPIDATPLGGWEIIQVAAGGDRSLVLAEDGFVFSFGWQGGGSVPRPINRTNLMGMRVTEISSGIYDHLLVAEPRLEGDYNDNGVVDAADYVVWRDTMGQLVIPGRGPDGNANGEITQLDYGYWKERFGNVLASGGGSAGATVHSKFAIPEPSISALCACGVIGLIAFRCHRHDKLTLGEASPGQDHLHDNGRSR